MKRSASLDFLRGAAAFAVAIPHYLTANAPFQPFAESFAIAGVELFFVLSGFVLAPQIVDWVVNKPWRNLGVFLIRRWMRTIPPYVVALVVIAVLTGNLLTADFVRYLRAPGRRHLIMGHPGYCDEELVAADPVTRSRERELSFLLSPAFTAMLDRKRARLARLSDAFCTIR